MTAFTSHFAFEFRTGIRNKNLLLMNYLFPLGLYVMMSLIMPAVNPLFQATIIPSMITFGILAAALLGLPDPLVQAREAAQQLFEQDPLLGQYPLLLRQVERFWRGHGDIN